MTAYLLTTSFNITCARAVNTVGTALLAETALYAFTVNCRLY